jgi:hypothetical protein
LESAQCSFPLHVVFIHREVFPHPNEYCGPLKLECL